VNKLGLEIWRQKGKEQNKRKKKHFERFVFCSAEIHGFTS
jgi:hypothetical protein